MLKDKIISFVKKINWLAVGLLLIGMLGTSIV